MPKEKLTPAVKTAREIVGDDKLPNKYWVSISDQWLTNKANKANKESNHYDWSGDVYKDLPEAYEIYGPFDTFEQATEKFDELQNECDSPENVDSKFHSVQIEDRLTGTLYEGTWRETLYEKKYRGEKLRMVSFEWEVTDDTSFTRREMERRGATFE